MVSSFELVTAATIHPWDGYGDPFPVTDPRSTPQGMWYTTTSGRRVFKPWTAIDSVQVDATREPDPHRIPRAQPAKRWGR
jgi:hypothetical protein